MRTRQKRRIVFFSTKNTKMGSEWLVQFLERESSFFLDFPPFRRSVRFRPRSKAVLRVDTDLVEFRQLQEVGIFSYLVYSLAKSHFMDRDLLRPEGP